MAISTRVIPVESVTVELTRPDAEQRRRGVRQQLCVNYYGADGRQGHTEWVHLSPETGHKSYFDGRLKAGREWWGVRFGQDDIPTNAREAIARGLPVRILERTEAITVRTLPGGFTRVLSAKLRKAKAAA
jgi:hypothetical protein